MQKKNGKNTNLIEIPNGMDWSRPKANAFLHFTVCFLTRLMCAYGWFFFSYARNSVFIWFYLHSKYRYKRVPICIHTHQPTDSIANGSCFHLFFAHTVCISFLFTTSGTSNSHIHTKIACRKKDNTQEPYQLFA